MPHAIAPCTSHNRTGCPYEPCQDKPDPGARALASGANDSKMAQLADTALVAMEAMEASAATWAASCIPSYQNSEPATSVLDPTECNASTSVHSVRSWHSRHRPQRAGAMPMIEISTPGVGTDIDASPGSSDDASPTDFSLAV